MAADVQTREVVGSSGARPATVRPSIPTVSFVSRLAGEAYGGLGRYETSLLPELEAICPVVRRRVEPWPVPRWVTAAVGRAGLDLATVVRQHPAYLPAPRPSGIVHLANQMLAANLVWQRPPGPTVVTVQDIIPIVAPSQPWNSEPQTNVEWLLIRQWALGLKRADRLIAISRATRDDLIRYLGIAPGRIRVVLLGVDHATFAAVPAAGGDGALLASVSVPAGTPFVLYVGSHHERKNLAVLVRAMARARERLPKLSLVLVGGARGARDAASETGFADLVEAGAVKELGHVSIEALAALYRAASVAVLPSWYEGFGLPALEAMACGCPTIGANTSSIPEVVGDGGLLFDPTDEGQLADQIVHVVTDPSLARSLRQRGLERAAGFTWARTARETSDVYAELAAAGGKS